MGTQDPTAPFSVTADPTGRLSVAVVPLGLACCAVEVAAALDGDLPEGWAVSDVPAVVDASDVRILVVSGTVSEASVPAVLARWAGLAPPRAAVSFGACSNSGGPYWDSYAVAKGVDQFLPVATYVPGCPPRPQLLLAALRDVAATLLADADADADADPADAVGGPAPGATTGGAP